MLLYVVCVFFQLLLLNPVNMLITFGACTEGIIASGMSTFMPKFMENQYGYSAGLSAMIVGKQGRGGEEWL